MLELAKETDDLSALSGDGYVGGCGHGEILDAVSDGVFVLDGDGYIVFANESSHRILGYSHRGIHGTSVHQLLHPTTNEGSSGKDKGWQNNCSLCQGLRDGQGQRARRGEFRRRDGSFFPVQYNVVPLTTQKGSGQIALIFADLTPQRKLREEIRRLRAIIEDTPNFVSTADGQGNVLYYNKAARKMLGIGEAEKGPFPPLKGRQPEEAARVIVEEALPTAIRDGAWHGESVLARPDGRRIALLQTIVAHKDDDGNVEYFSAIGTDITERKRMEKQLAFLANCDTLTGVMNRARFQASLKEELERARKEGGSGAVLYVDLDEFKHVNDTLGHHAGDEMLRRIARAMEGSLRERDALARLGGDEFAVLLPDTSLTDAKRIGERLLARIGEELIRMEGRTRRERASMGVATYPHDATTVEEVLIHADLSMYEAKRRGGDGLSVYDAARFRAGMR